MLLAPCLLHAAYHPEPDTDCALHAMRWFMAHAHLTPNQAWDAYEAAVESAILDHHIRQHLKETTMPVPQPCDPDGERQPQRQDDDLPTAA